MADYREISQVYAKSAINGVIIVNAGAATALLTQLSKLIELQAVQVIVVPLLCWTTGISIGLATWLVAFVSARFVDKSQRELNQEGKNLFLANLCMYLAMLFVASALGCFVAGAYFLSDAEFTVTSSHSTNTPR